MTEKRLEELEIKLSFQEDTIQELNKVIYQQQQKIDQLEAVCRTLLNRLQDLSDTVAEGRHIPHEKPPHY